MTKPEQRAPAKPYKVLKEVIWEHQCGQKMATKPCPFEGQTFTQALKVNKSDTAVEIAPVYCLATGQLLIRKDITVTDPV